MSTLEDVSKINQAGCSKQEKETLLSKYRIPIQHFEFDYIQNCTDGRELEKILLILQSGEEGYYPELIKSATERLNVIKPKSKLLREISSVISINDLEERDREEMSKDLESWLSDINKNDKELDDRRTAAPRHDTKVRAFKGTGDIKKLSENKKTRIASTDYAAWDKYDPDTELLKMELQEENEKKCVVLKRTISKPKKVSSNKFATEAEAIFTSNREREKGNEFFKIGEYENALECYTESIQSKPGVRNLNNRAATYLKLGEHQKALDDCEWVLAIETGNLKALLRKAEALEKLARFEEALESIDFVIQRDPNSYVAQELAGRVRKHSSNSMVNIRMKIVELE